MAEVVFAIPGDLATPTGGYAYDREVLKRLAGAGLAVSHLALPAGFPSPTAAELAETARLLEATPPDGVLLIDGLAYGALPASLIAQIRRPIIALVHHPLAYEAGLPPGRIRELLTLERDALALARHVIVSSPLTARLLADEFAVPRNRITVAEPGTEPAARATGTGDPPTMLAVGAISPRKAYPVLIDALSTLADQPWSLTIAGATNRDGEAVQVLEAAIARHQLGDRVRLIGSVRGDALDTLYAAADLFVMPSLFEGYGMVLAEAMARGLAIVCTTGGAAAETVPDGAAIKVPPGDAAALASALRDVLTRPALRHALAEQSWRAGQGLPRWDQTASIVARVLEDVVR